MQKGKTNRIALYGMLIAAAMILSYIETFIPVFAAVPGMKIGLANIVVVFALYSMGTKQAAAISAVRILLVAFSFGNLFSMAYSLAGAVLSLAVMALMKKSGAFGVAGVSVAGGVCHNIGQLILAAFLLETSRLMYYLPFLIISGAVSGTAIGILAAVVIKRMNKNNSSE